MKRSILTLDRKLNLTDLPEGYIGSLPVKTLEWDLARLVTQARMLATQMRGRKVSRDDDKQFWLDMKGAIAEIVFNGFLLDLQKAGNLEGEFDYAPLVDLKPARRPDLSIKKDQALIPFDIKGSSALIEGLSLRDDKLITVSQWQMGSYEKEGYAGIVACKTYGVVMDVCYYRLETVKNWGLRSGKNASTSPYYHKAMPVFEAEPEDDEDEA
jgi:hypothetical protein